MQATVSAQAMEWVLDHSPATGTDRLVLLAIARHADRAGEGAYPSAQTLAAEAAVHRVTAFRSIERLAASGAIVVEHGGGRHRPNTYRVVMEERSHTATVSTRTNGSATATESAPETVAETVALGTETVALESRNGSAEGVETVALSLPEPSTNQLQTTTTPPTPPKRGGRLPADFEVTQAMADWASATVPGVSVATETEKFRDHWHASAGKTATKLDWVAAWRLWMRRAVDYAPRNGFVRESVGDGNVRLLLGRQEARRAAAGRELGQ